MYDPDCTKRWARHTLTVEKRSLPYARILEQGPALAALRAAGLAQVTPKPGHTLAPT